MNSRMSARHTNGDIRAGDNAEPLLLEAEGWSMFASPSAVNVHSMLDPDMGLEDGEDVVSSVRGSAGMIYQSLLSKVGKVVLGLIS